MRHGCITLHEEGKVGKGGERSAASEVLNVGSVREYKPFDEIRASAAVSFAARERIMGEVCRALELRIAELNCFCLALWERK